MHRLASGKQSEFEELLAELTDAVCRVTLEHGINGPFLDMELDLWMALRSALGKQQSPPAGLGTESFKDQRHLDAIVGEAKEIVGHAMNATDPAFHHDGGAR